MFTLSPALVLWAREAFHLFFLCLRSTYSAQKHLDLQTSQGHAAGDAADVLDRRTGRNPLLSWAEQP